MTTEMSSGIETHNDAVCDANLSSIDESGLKTLPGDSKESAARDSTNIEKSAVDGLDDHQPPFKELLLEIVADGHPTSASNLVKLQELLVKDKSQVDFPDADGNTALHVAAKHGLLNVAKELISAGARISAEDSKQRQPLHRACSKGHTEVVKLLLGKGADIEAKKRGGATPLDGACRKGHIDVVNLLLRRDSKIQVTDDKRWSPANIQVMDDKRWSPLYSASYFGHEDVVRCLLDTDISNINSTEDENGWTALHAATYNGHDGVVSALLEHLHEAALGIKDNDDWTPLMTAIRQEHLDIMKRLIPGSKPYLETRDNTGRTPLLAATINRFSEGVRQLIAAGASCNAQSERSGNTPLTSASSWGYTEIVKDLLEANADVHKSDHNHETALHKASWNNNIKIVELLIAKLKTSHLEEKDIDGQTALHFASLQGNAFIVELLLKNNAIVDAIDKEGKTPLHFASGAGDEDKSYPDPDRVGPDDWTDDERDNPKFQSGRHKEVVQLLLDKKAKPGHRTSNLDTAFHFAAECGDPERLGLILSKMENQDLLIRNKHERTALCSAFMGDKLGDKQGDKRGTAMKAIMKSGKIETVDFGLNDTGNDMGNDVLEWTAKKRHTHGIAKWLFQKRPQNIKAMQSPESAKWSPIVWAVYEQLPRVLLFLLKESDHKTPEFDVALKSALDLLEKIKKRPQSSTTSQKLESLSRPDSSIPLRQGGNKDPQEGSNRGEMEQGVRQIEPGQKSPEALRSKNLAAIEDLLLDPYFFKQMDEDRGKCELPQPTQSAVVREVLANFKATIVQIYREGDVSTIIRRYRPVRETIYDAGPKGVMKEATKFLIGILGKDSRLSGQTEPKFTWVHLPATSIDWMNDLVTRIMYDEGCSASNYHEVRSFFRDSWFEIPDRKSDSRIMRPRTVTRQDVAGGQPKDVSSGNPENRENIEDEKVEQNQEIKMANDGRDGEEGKRGQEETKKSQENEPQEEADTKKNKAKTEKERPKEKESGFVAASAIYMPYLCFSTLCGEGSGLSEGQEKFKEIEDDYRRLLEAYKEGVVHGSPTLDEWYYHFGPGEKSTKDKDSRNRTQVVTKFLKDNKSTEECNGSDKPIQSDKDKAGELSQWPLLRVNQLWVWTLKKEWLITANSCLFDDSHDALVEGVLDQLNKQAEYGGSGSQPETVADMRRFIVDYCIGSYERRRKADGQTKGRKAENQNTESGKPDGQTTADQKAKDNISQTRHDQMSIGQIFSNYMNQIGRDETFLFEDFSRRTQDWKQGAEGNGNENTTESSSLVQGSSEIGPKSGASPVDEIRSAIKNAEKLYCDIKDVRDELNILKSVAQYQRDVQRVVAREGARDANLSAASIKQMKDSDLPADYIVNDIEEMDIVADRIQSSVNTTLSLQQSEIANFQATLSLQQSEIATDQGKILMVFTFATLLFLPLSFLSSLFALDVASFLQTPGWAFAVIFLVSVAVSVALGLIAFHWSTLVSLVKEHTKLKLRGLRDKGASKTEKKNNDRKDLEPPLQHPDRPRQHPEANASTDDRRKRMYSRFWSPGGRQDDRSFWC